MNDAHSKKLIGVLERLTDEVHRCHLAIDVTEEDRALLQASLKRAQRIANRVAALDSKTNRP